MSPGAIVGETKQEGKIPAGCDRYSGLLERWMGVVKAFDTRFWGSPKEVERI